MVSIKTERKKIVQEKQNDRGSRVRVCELTWSGELRGGSACE